MSAYNKIGFLGSSVGGMSTTIGTGHNKRNFGIGDYVRQLDAAGIPAAIACNDGNGGIMDAINLILNGSKVPHVLGYRIVKPDDKPVEHYSVPDYMLHPGEAAQKHFNLLKPVIERKVDLPKYREHLWWFPVNEIRAKRAVDEATGKKEPQFNDMNAWDWMGEFCYEFALLANQEGYKVAMPQANSGEPKIKELDDVAMDAWKQPGMKKFLQLCAKRPQQVCVGLHEYSWEVSDDMGGILAGYPTKVGRFQYLFRACDEMGIARPNIIFGEWGWKHDRTPPPEVGIRHIRQVAEIYARHPQILGAFIWYLGPYNNSSRINNDTVRLLEPVTRKTLEWRFPDPQPNGSLDIPTQAKPKDADNKPIVVTGKHHSETTEVKAVWGTVNSQYGLNLRSEPATDGGESTVKIMLENGTRLKILNTVADRNPAMNRQWYEVEAAGETGYVSTDFVLAEKMPPKQETKEETRKITRSRALETGMNINPDAPHSDPVATGLLRGMDWVRLVFKIDDRQPAEARNLNSAFAQYDPIVEAYRDQGVKTLFVINQETRQPFHTNPNWREPHHWSAYCQHLAGTVGQIAAHYRSFGSGIAYQLWNEGDKQYDPNQTEVDQIPSVFLTPQAMAELVQKVAAAIRHSSPDALIVFNGMAETTEKIIHYWQTCQSALNGSWPVDALAIHPYTFVATEAGAPFDWANKRNFLKDALARYQAVFPDMPIWITEMGVAVDNRDKEAVSTDHAYREIAKYIKDVYRQVNAEHAAQVPVLIWFAWSDNMRNAGMVKSDGTPKPHLFEAFQQIRDRTIL
ncbi:MAG: hypothetical protein CL608_23305 [Anaerolineaceae bacterium]|nr:hypothetical protein [Anaerolineaceae bacterium]